LKPPQERKLASTEVGDVRDRLHPRQHRKQAQKQNFAQRITDLAGLACIRPSLEIAKKQPRFRKTVLSSRSPTSPVNPLKKKID